MYKLNPQSEYAKKRKKISFIRFLFSQTFAIIVLLILEVVFLLNFFMSIRNEIIFAFSIIDFLSIVYIVNSKKVKTAYKLSWILLFNLIPFVGILFFIFIKFATYIDNHRVKLRNIILNSKRLYKSTDDKVISDFVQNFNIEDISREHFDYKEHIINEKSFQNYFLHYAHTPQYTNNDIEYFSDGCTAFEDILEKLSNAQKFIFIEIFILNDGIIWQEMLNILKEKAKNGVEVRIMFDGLNAISSFNKSYCKYLATFNIEARIFKPIVPFLSSTQNNRDHRKIFIIDNKVAYTGGINISDEYANLYERFGYWKDVAVRVSGSAVEGFTIMFLQVWSVQNKSDVLDFQKYLDRYDKIVENDSKYAITVPYTDYPNFTENISLSIFQYMFNSASKYMYIMTPYLVIDDIIVDALESAAKRGVDVRIIVPHIPDKKYVFWVNRSYYKSLTMAGVKVYEYLPGFIHAKVFLEDDVRAVVGTANLDYRSLYLHYENGLYIFADDKSISQIKNDFENTLKDSIEMTFIEIDKIPLHHKIFGSVLKMFAPLM